ncbi:MAG TPA: pre-peptidase C-terminal domain-containing protein [Thermoanaerobaculia bacterium]|nr:pre-peptidase C-terminal domain-containing protein [Thermoanaerobaculia bacterium]
MKTTTRILALLSILCLVAAVPASAQNSADWNSCWCGGWASAPINITCYEGSGHTGGCTSELNNWNNHANLFTVVPPAGGVTLGNPGNGINEVNSPITSAQASSRYGYSLDSTTYGVALMEPEANFGNFNSCESIGSPNGQPSGQGCGNYTQADVLINANFSSAWTTSKTAYDGKAVVQTTVLHEVGHILGMHHVFNHFSTMNYMNDDSGWFVTRIDARNIRAHYPSAAKAVTDMGVYPFKYGASQYGETYATFTPTSVAAGGTTSLSNIRVENVGNAASLSNVTVTFYLSSDTNITTGDTVVGTLSWPSFSTWWESSSAITLTIPSSVASGTYYIGGIVSASGVTDGVGGNDSFLVRTRSGAAGTPRAITVTGGGCTLPGTTTLSAPAAGATGVAASPTLSWSAVSGATSYDLYLSTGSTPTFLKNVTTTSTTAGPLAANTLHYWNVVAKNTCGSGPASATRSFTTAATSGATPLTNGQAVTGLSGATGTWKHYVLTVPASQSSLAIVMSGGTGDADLYVKRGAQPTSTVYDYRPYLGGNAESVNVTNPVAGDWYISIYSYAAYSGVSLTATYTGTSCTLPGVPALSAPAASATGVSTSPALSWAAVSGATSYDVYLSTASSPAFLRNVTTTSTTAGPLTAGTVYYWTVIARNSCGAGTAAATRSFTTATVAGVTTLTNGQTLSNLSGATGSWAHYKISVPTGQNSLVIATTGGTGDLDMYVKLNAQPTSSVYDYRPYVNGNNETVTVSNPAAGDWYISLYGYAAYAGASLTATYTAAPGCTSVSGSFATAGGSQYQPSSSGYIVSLSGAHTGVLSGPAGTDFDLYLEKYNGSSWASVASGTGSTSAENVNYSGTSGTYRWRVHAYSGTGSYTLCTTKP